jgi:hypothetical protein
MSRALQANAVQPLAAPTKAPQPALKRALPRGVQAGRISLPDFKYLAAAPHEGSFVPPFSAMLWRQPIWRIMPPIRLIRFGVLHSHIPFKGAAIP